MESESYLHSLTTSIITPHPTHCKAIKKDLILTEPTSITYTDPTSQIRTWESAYRPTRPTNSDIDAIGIAAILQPSPTLSSSTKVSPLVAQVQASGKPCLLLQRQFRPPVEKVCVEVPAGLVDEGETAEQCAIRELKEETGFVGEIMGGGFGVTPVMFNGELHLFSLSLCVSLFCLSSSSQPSTSSLLTHIH